MDSSSQHWQKVAVIVSVMLFAVPAGAVRAWRALYPEHLLVVEAAETAPFSGVATASITIHNQGTQREENVMLSVEADSIEGDALLAAVSDATSFNVYSADTMYEHWKVAPNGHAQVRIGRILPGESIRVSLVGVGRKLTESVQLDPSFGEPKVTSDLATGVEASSDPLPGSLSLRSAYFEMSPYAFAFVVGLFVVMIGVGIIYELFFSTPQKQMAALWRQMDLLQEKIDKERRYQ
jgi:hypothetical protein